MSQITGIPKALRFAFACASMALALIVAGCATTASYRHDIDGMKGDLAEAKAAGAEKLAPDEYAHAEACLDWLMHEATEFRPIADPNTGKYVGKCRPAFQALKNKMVAAREAKPPAPPVPVPVVPPMPPAPAVDEGIYPKMGTLEEALSALPREEEPPPVIAAAPPMPPAPAVDEGIYPKMGTLEEALSALPREEEPPPVIAAAPPAPEVTPAPAPAPPPPAEAPPVTAPAPLPAPVALAPAVVAKEPERVKGPPLEDIFFDYDQSVIRPDAQQSLDRNVQWLGANQKATIIIEGHCDERGTREYNLGLGERRAKAALDFLVASGIDANRIKTISYGNERPFDVGHDEDAWKWNRRAHFVLP